MTHTHKIESSNVAVKWCY